MNIAIISNFGYNNESEKKHLLVIHPKFCIHAQKKVECLLLHENYQITIITYVEKYGHT